MVFKLIRIDTQEPSKIQLNIGKHIIGRGKFLHNDDTDKRVSRNHAELEVTEDTITLRSLHQNPCFYLKKNTQDTELLQQNCDISLCNGDKFGLIPETFWYEIIHCTAPESPEQNVPTDVLDRVENSTNGEETVQPVEGTVNESNRYDQRIIFYVKEEIEDPNRSASPSLLTTEQNNPVSESTQPYNPAASAPQVANSPAKRSHSEDSPNGDAKKVKTEPDETGDARPGPSNDQAGSTDCNKNAPASPVKPANNVPLRERCIYGASCYRRNPQHKAQFSHPSDSDWGSGQQAACPFGRSCRRRDPRHWRDHHHPPGTDPPPQNQIPGMQMVQRHGNIFYINAHSVNFYDDHFQVEDSDGDSVDYDYEF